MEAKDLIFTEPRRDLSSVVLCSVVVPSGGLEKKITLTFQVFIILDA